MPAKKKPAAKKTVAKKTVAKTAAAKKPLQATTDERVAFALAWLNRKATKQYREILVRFGIAATNALGVSLTHIQQLAKELGRDHALALALWDTECYEARLLAAFVDEPSLVTAAQMDRWCRDFDNWGVCDTLCFKLFDQTVHAWTMVAKWANRENEYEKRAAFALMASLALHDKKSADTPFKQGLALIERAASDDRNFVWKGVNWALRSIGRRNAVLRADAIKLSARLAESDVRAERWVGKGALKELQKARR